MITKIRYTGESISENGISYLTKGKVYNLSCGWHTGCSINNHWVFYIYDDIDDGDFRGYEINVKYIETLREANLDVLLS